MSLSVYLRQLETCETLDDVSKVCARIASELGFDYGLCILRVPLSFVRVSMLMVGNAPKPWLARYEEPENFTVDPVFAHCATSLQPYSWSRLREEVDESYVRRFLADARSHGLRSGVSLGLWGNNGENTVLSFTSSADELTMWRKIDGAIPLMHMILPYLYETVRHLAGPLLGEATDVRLTKREQECLSWTAEGKTNPEVAAILQISEATVTFHMRNAMQKLNVTNRSQAVAKAILLRLIAPQEPSILFTSFAQDRSMGASRMGTAAKGLAHSPA